MEQMAPPPRRRHSAHSRIRSLGVAFLALALPACASGPAELPDPRPIIIRSGARLQPEKERMKEIDQWFRAEQTNIEEDPTFLIEVVPRDTPAYPWESLFLTPSADTAKIGVEGGESPQAQYVYMLYAHLHLMYEKGRLDEWLPGTPFFSDYERERAMVERVAEAWLYARSVFDAVPYEPLEEITYANEHGYLEAFILTARGDEFEDEREAWLEEDPQALEDYRSWFVDTFSREPPGLRDSGTR